MGEDTVTTGVDDLLAYLRGKDRVALQDAATVLNVNIDTVQAWVDFLVEEKILGIEYKFTKPFIYLNREEKLKKTKIIEQTSITLDQLKQEYEEHARMKQIPSSKIPALWAAHVQEALSRKKMYFMEQANRRRADDPEKLWDEYQADIITRAA